VARLEGSATLTYFVHDGWNVVAEDAGSPGSTAHAHEVRPDSQGRITIPQRLREFASLDKEAVVIGAFGRIEVWNAGRWNDQASLADDSLTQAVTSLGL
jgi:hypothetical protein